MKQDINTTLVSQSSTDLVPHNNTIWERLKDRRKHDPKTLMDKIKREYPLLPSESYKIPPCAGHEIENQKEEGYSEAVFGAASVYVADVIKPTQEAKS